MSQTLYRKYRSQRFAELVGQRPVVRILQSSIMRERLSHAYLFSGPRGTGKTSVARIFAKALNCREPRDGDACGVCEVCRSVADGSAVDVVEIDAASNRGIDDIRELRERVAYAPLKFKYKVYIIDEVHMITPQGFNALLKTLEEPPSHIVFCLCTTEAHKLPITILSRCIRFDFQLLPLDALAGHLESIAEQEGYVLATEAAAELARLSEGSARDAISLLDQLLVYCDHEIDREAVLELFQLVDPELVPRTVKLLAAGDPQPLLQVWHELVSQGADPGQFLLKVADGLKQRYLTDKEPAWRAALEAVWQGVNLLKHESFPSVLVELTLLNAQAALVDTSSGRGTLAQTEDDTAPEPVAQRRDGAVTTVQPAVEQGSALTPQLADAVDVADERGWQEFVEAVRSARTTTYAMIFDGVTGVVSDDELEVVFAHDRQPAFRFAQRDEHASVLRAVATQLFGDGTRVVLKLAGEADSAVEVTTKSQPEVRTRDPLPPELVSEVLDDEVGGEHSQPTIDPEALGSRAAEMSTEISADAKAQPAGEQRSPTVREAMSLFGVVEEDSENEEGRSEE